MMRAGYRYGTIDYAADTIPTLGASNGMPHLKAIEKMQETIDEETHPIRTYFRKKITPKSQ